MIENNHIKPSSTNEFPCETAQRLGQRLLIAGCGYLGQALARQLHAIGWNVVGITRTDASALCLQTEPYRVLACDICDRAALSALCPFDTVISCVSSGRSGADVYRKIYLEGTHNLFEAFHPARFLFVSSTSVYAQTDGSVVTEESPAEPMRETGQILRQAEEMALAAGGTVARLAGIYGNDRWALLKKFLNRTVVIEGDGNRYLNQIHRADAVSALAYMINNDHKKISGIFNVSDGSPTTERDLYAAFSAHFQRPLPPSAPPNPDRKRGWTHKQVSNVKLRALGWAPLYPSFREALAGMQTV